MQVQQQLSQQARPPAKGVAAAAAQAQTGAAAEALETMAPKTQAAQVAAASAQAKAEAQAAMAAEAAQMAAAAAQATRDLRTPHQSLAAAGGASPTAAATDWRVFDIGTPVRPTGTPGEGGSDRAFRIEQRGWNNRSPLDLDTKPEAYVAWRACALGFLLGARHHIGWLLLWQRSGCRRSPWRMSRLELARLESKRMFSMWVSYCSGPSRASS